MKNLNLIVSVSFVTAVCFYGLTAISKDNEFTSVRKYAKPAVAAAAESVVVPAVRSENSWTAEEGSGLVGTGAVPTSANSETTDGSGVLESSGTMAPPSADVTPPMVEFANYQDGDVVTDASVNIEADVSDDVSPLDKIRVEGTGKQNLKVGFNPIVVSAVDEAGNTAHAYIILERR